MTCGAERPGDTVVAVPTPSRLPWPAIALATVLALAAATGTYAVLDDDEPDPPEMELSPDDGELAFTTFEDEAVPLSSLRGTPTVLNFFASTCIPCVTEMPAFEEVHQALGDQVTFLGLAVADRPEDALALVDRTGVTYRTAQDKDNSVFTALGGLVLPTTVLLDADGEVVADHTGELDAEELRTWLADELDVES